MKSGPRNAATEMVSAISLYGMRDDCGAALIGFEVLEPIGIEVHPPVLVDRQASVRVDVGDDLRMTRGGHVHVHLVAEKFNDRDAHLQREVSAAPVRDVGFVADGLRPYPHDDPGARLR